jgi:hypothetical protein
LLEGEKTATAAPEQKLEQENVPEADKHTA